MDQNNLTQPPEIWLYDLEKDELRLLESDGVFTPMAAVGAIGHPVYSLKSVETLVWILRAGGKTCFLRNIRSV